MPVVLIGWEDIESHEYYLKRNKTDGKYKERMSRNDQGREMVMKKK